MNEEMRNRIAGILMTEQTLLGQVDELEVLVESVIRECARVANDNVGAFTPSCGNFVMDHFGVKREEL